MHKKYTICTLGGDGIGTEVIAETVQLLLVLPIKWHFIPAEAGFSAFNRYGTPLPEKTITTCKNADAVLFGAVTSPPNIPRYFSPIVRLRKILDIFANVRPFFSLPIPPSRQGIDCVIIRENTEDLYAGKERLTDDGAIAERVITKKACARIIEFAFQFAVREKRKKVTLVHKANVLRLTDGLFLSIGQQIAQKYPAIVFDDMLVDATAMQLIKKPEAFDVIVTTNMFGDILSDEAAALIGGLGVAASANIGNQHALFEPVHGSAPKHAGKNTANPLAAFFAATMMLDYLGKQEESKRVTHAIIKTLKQGQGTRDVGGTNTTREFAKKVIQNIGV